jgi:hypothetical protein
MFKIVIDNIPDRELGPVVAGLHLPRGVEMEQTHYADPDEHFPPAPPKKRKKGRRRGHKDLLTTKLTMTGKIAVQKGSAVAKGLELFELCEASLGIGNVMVEDFRAYLKKNRMQKPENLQKRMIRDGYLDYLD